jgi:tetratricopeptide (TPR) repeat protein
MKRTRTAVTVGIIALCITGAVAGHAARTGEKQPEQRPEQKEQKVDKATEYYNQGLKLSDAGDFEKAMKMFEKANKERDDDPEILNMLAFSQRKVGKLSQAFTNYERALEIRPNFPQAREYLGEAYLDAALVQVKELNGYGPNGEKELAQLRAAFEKVAWQLGITGQQQAPAAGTERKW